MIISGETHPEILREGFPNVQNSAQITSPPTSVYNCIAYAAGDVSRWWWPDPLGLMYWPPGILRLPTLPVFQMAYESIGFQLCADDAFQADREKIAIFHLRNEPTHAAKLIGEGTWSSKLGKWYDISHTKTCLDNDAPKSYGTIAFLMERIR